jgi:hypothetical protein
VFRTRRYEGPHRFTQKRPRTFVAALQSFAAVRASKNQLSRDFRSGSIFDFCNTIRQQRPFHNRSCRDSPTRSVQVVARHGLQRVDIIDADLMIDDVSAAPHTRLGASGFDRRFGGLVAGKSCTVVFFHRLA